MKRDYRLTIRFAPEEKKVLDALSDAYSEGDQAMLLHKIVQDIGQNFNILTPGDLSNLQQRGRMSKAAYA